MFAPDTRILVVDDMLTMRKLVIKALKDIGFTNFTEAPDGAKGWEALEGASPKIDLVVSDWNMPNCTGLDLLKRVRGDGRFKVMPFVLLTAESERDQVAAALQAGVSGYVVKPFSVDALKVQLEKVSAKLAAA
jgi:two-component system chemotaxis response regulator CheY